jgi:hypothetical protein
MSEPVGVVVSVVVSVSVFEFVFEGGSRGRSACAFRVAGLPR